jgi:DNA processing protein
MDDDVLARLALSRLVEPGQWPVYDAVQRYGAVAVWDALRAGRPLGSVSEATAGGSRVRAERYDVLDDVRQLDRVGGRFVVPNDAEWPKLSLDWTPGVEAPPLGLFLRGPRQLSQVVDQAVSVVGARASSVYGAHVAGELALGVADRGWTVVSGGAYGVDGAAHGGALSAARGGTIAVLACGVDVTYPKGHDQLLERIAAAGLIVSEHPPGCAPTRPRFLIRNRLIAALSEGTVVVEAALRSGSLTTARQARDLGRHLMAVPGPVTNEMSAGSNMLLRNGANCVTCAGDVLDVVGRLVLDAAPEPRGPASPRDHLTDTERQVLEAVPVRRWAGPASIAKTAGVATMTVQQTLPPLQVAGLVEQSFEGWRLTPLGAGRPARAAS